MIKVSLKEILKMDVSILNKYFLVTLILVLLTIVGYTSYALFSYEEISSTSIRLKYSGEVELPQSEGNLSSYWLAETTKEASYLALYTLGSSDLPSTYSYNGTTYTLSTTIDVSEQGNGNVILGEYVSGSNMIAVIGQNGKVIAPKSCYHLFYELTKATIIDVSDLDTTNVTDMFAMFHSCYSLTSLDLTTFDTRNVTDMSNMFEFCSNLNQIFVGCNWKTASTRKDMFNQARVSDVTKVCNE